MQTWAAPHTRGRFHAAIEVPGSKSMTNRALVLAALAEGRSTLSGWLKARDTNLMIGGLQGLGAHISEGPEHLVVQGGPVRSGRVECGLAGTVMRFLPPVAAMAPGDVEFTGDPHASARPLTPMLQALRDLGAQITGDRLPFTVHGMGSLRGGTVTLDASASSQFVSGLLLSAAAMQRGLLMRHVGPPLPSAPHIEMTMAMLAEVGIPVLAEGDQWEVAPEPIAAHDWTIEPDLSNAGPFLAAAVATGSHVSITKWPKHTTQAGDYWRHFLTDLGAQVVLDDAGLHVEGPEGYDGFTVDLRAVGELTPTIAALAALADSSSTITGIGHLRGHETDRLRAIATELRRVGVDVAEQADGLTIDPAGRVSAGSVTMRTYADHRMATMAAILALRIEGLQVQDPQTTTKTMPDFVGQWEAMLG